MADTQGLFGPTAEQIMAAQRQQREDQANKFAQLDTNGMVRNLMYTGAAGLTDAVAGGLGATNNDPALKEAADQQHLMQYAQQNNLDMNTPEGAMKLAQYAQQINPNLSQKIAQYGMSIAKQQQDLELSKAHSKYYTDGGKVAGKAGTNRNDIAFANIKNQYIAENPDATESEAAQFALNKLKEIEAKGAGLTQGAKEAAKPEKALPAPIVAKVADVDYQTEVLNNSVANITKLRKEAEGLNLGLVQNWTRAGRSWLGVSDPEMQAFNRAQQSMLQEANNILMAANGVQTEGDAKRAVQMIASGEPFKNKEALKAMYDELERIHKDTVTALSKKKSTLVNLGSKPASQQTTAKPNYSYQAIFDKVKSHPQNAGKSDAQIEAALSKMGYKKE